MDQPVVFRPSFGNRPDRIVDEVRPKSETM